MRKAKISTSGSVTTGLTNALDNYFYRFFREHERTEDEKVVMCTTADNIKVPVKDWRYGRDMSGAQIMQLADYFYKLGQANNINL